MKTHTFVVRLGSYRSMWPSRIVFEGSKQECERWIHDNLKPGEKAYVDYVSKEVLI